MSPGNPGFYKKDDREKVAELGLMDGRMKIFYYIRRFWEIPKKEKNILISGIFNSGIFFLIVKFIPLKFYLKYLCAVSLKYKCNEDCQDDIKVILRNINRINKIVPWKFNCLNRALTSKSLFDKLKIMSEIRLSILKTSNNQFIAHADLTINIEDSHRQELSKHFRINFNNTRYSIV